jgi:hypothetical protein
VKPSGCGGSNNSLSSRADLVRRAGNIMASRRLHEAGHDSKGRSIRQVMQSKSFPRAALSFHARAGGKYKVASEGRRRPSQNRPPCFQHSIVNQRTSGLLMTVPIRSFTSQLEDPIGRSLDDAAPPGLRQEFLDAAFHVIEQAGGYSDARLYHIITRASAWPPQDNHMAAFVTRSAAISAGLIGRACTILSADCGPRYLLTCSPIT